MIFTLLSVNGGQFLQFGRRELQCGFAEVCQAIVLINANHGHSNSRSDSDRPITEFPPGSSPQSARVCTQHSLAVSSEFGENDRNQQSQIEKSSLAVWVGDFTNSQLIMGPMIFGRTSPCEKIISGF